MKALMIILLHSLLNIAFGLAVLSILKKREITVLRIVQAFVIGIFVESTIGFLFLYFEVQEYWSLVLLSVVGIAYLIYSYFVRGQLRFTVNFKTEIRLHFLEWGLVVLIIQKVVSSIYSLLAMPLYFDDAMTHWNGRARAIFGNANWSVFSNDFHFLGQRLGYKEYPFLSPIWRANTAHLNGSWNDIISRGDGLIFFIILLLAVYQAVKLLKAPRWVGLSAVFVIASMPLQFVHSVSGYSEITIQALSVVALICLLRKEWIVFGLTLGAMIFTKNEGLLLYFPLFLLLSCVTIFLEPRTLSAKLKSVALVLLSSLALVVPWLSFKLSAGVPFSTPIKEENYYHTDAFGWMIKTMFSSASSSIFWIFFFVMLLIGLPKIIKSWQLALIASLVLLLLAALFYIFCFTGANVFLMNQMTIHRSLLQVAPLAIILVAGLMTMNPTQDKSETNVEI